MNDLKPCPFCGGQATYDTNGTGGTSLNLKEIFEVFWTITECDITARDSNGYFLHKWKYAPKITETVHMKYDRLDGKLTLCEQKINAHGDQTRGGSEMGWGVKPKIFPDALLSAPITHMTASSLAQGNGHVLYVDVEMQPLTVMTLTGGQD